MSSEDGMIELLERYLLAADKETFFATLVRGSDVYKRLRVIDSLNRNGLQLPEESKRIVDEYLGDEQLRKNTLASFRYQLLQIAAEKDATTRKKQLEEFNKSFLHCNFTYSAPTTVGKGSRLAASDEKAKLPSELDCAVELSLESVVAQAQKDNGRGLHAIRPEHLHHVDLAALTKTMEPDDFSMYMQSVDTLTHLPNAGKIIADYVSRHREAGEAPGQLPSWVAAAVCEKLTLEQLLALEAQLGEQLGYEFIAAKFSKTFEADLAALEELRGGEDPTARRAVLVRMHDWTARLPTSRKNLLFASQVLRELLETDLLSNLVDTEVFVAYLRNPLRTEAGIFKDKPNAPADGDEGYEWHAVHRFACDRWLPSEEKLLDQCLERLLADRDHAATLMKLCTPYVVQRYLERAFYRAQLLNGVAVGTGPSALSEAEVASLRAERRLRFVPWSERRFLPGDSVTLRLEVKNVDLITVSVFRVETENYYRKSLTPIEERIDLTGLVPSKRLEHRVSCPPVQSQVIEFADLFAAQRGIYAVEFVGGGLSSRAVIRVGGLTAVPQALMKGVLLRLVDEQHRVCHGETTGVLMDGRVLRPQASLGDGILIPYASSARNATVALLHEGFADLFSLAIPAEETRLSFCLLANEEALAAGGSVPLLVVPHVTVNGRRVGVASLRKVRALVTSVNEDLVSSVVAFDKLTLDPKGKGVTLNYLVPPKTQRVEVRLTCELLSSAQEKYIELAAERSVSIDSMRGVSDLCTEYLSPCGGTQGDYRVEVRGRNGEPYAGHRVTVQLTSLYRVEDLTKDLETDTMGVVLLRGAGRYASHIQVSSAGQRRPARATLGPCTYDLSASNDVAALPVDYDVVEGEDLVLPLGSPDGAFHPRAYELVRVCASEQGNIVADLSAQLTSANGVLQTGKLTKGEYRLRYREVAHGKCVQLHVHAGVRWSASPAKYMTTRRGIVKLAGQDMLLATRGYRIDAATGTVELGVVSHDLSDVEVHAFAFTFFPKTLQQLVEMLRATAEEAPRETYLLKSSSNAYLSEKQLGDEVKYVLERKRHKAFMGNTLEKPPGLLQRAFVRETAEDEEELRVEKDYAEEKVMMGEMAVPELGLQKPMHAKMAVHQRLMRCAAPMGAAMGFGGGSAVQPADLSVARMNPFLAQAGLAVFGLAPDADSGLVRFTVPLDAGYSTLVLVVRNRHGSVIETRALPPSERRFQDVRLAEPKHVDRAYVQERVAHCLDRGAVYETRDASSTDMRVVDDVSGVLGVLRSISRDSELDEWDFLRRWASLSPEECLRLYDKYMCHELNVFMFFKDKEFYRTVVRPHIASKTRKQLIDLFLLGDSAALAEYLRSPALLSRLNAVEKTLLVAALRTQYPSECAAVAKAARDEVGPVSDRDPRLHERLFDTVLSGRVQDEPPPPPLPPAMPGATGGFGAGVNRARGLTRGGGPAGRSNMVAPQPMMMMAQCCSADSVGMPLEAECTAMESFEDADIEDDAVQIRKYRTLEKTNQYRERQYWRADELSCAANFFWCEALEHFAQVGTDAAPFLTANIVYATGSTAEMLLATGLLAVGLERPTHASQTNGQSLHLTAGGPCLVFSKAVQAQEMRRVDLDVLLSQRFCDPQDLYTVASGTRVLKTVDEFLIGKEYASRVVVTNATESELKLNLVLEVPQAAMPLASPEYTDNRTLELAPLTTQTIESRFYFPSEGEFAYFPASANLNGALVASAKSRGTLKVVRAHTAAAAMATIGDVLNQGSKDDILAFMKRTNLLDKREFTFDAIYWLLGDADFYAKVVALLRSRALFDETAWSFSILHGDLQTFGEYATWRYRGQPPTLTLLSPDARVPVQFVSCPALQLDSFDYSEFSPLVNARAHEIGDKQHNIRNRQFREAYTGFLQYLTQKSGALTARDYVYWCTYLLLQDRVELAIDMYNEHVQASADSADGGELCVQRDYLAAYVSLYTEAPAFATARAVATRYLAYPVFTWRNRFVEVLNQVAEVDAPVAARAGGAEAEDAASRDAAQAQREPYVSAELKGASVRITAANVARLTVRFYRIDVEVLFSVDPFMDLEGADYSYVTANETLSVTIASPSSQLAEEVVHIPAHLVDSNLIVQASSDTAVASVAYFPNRMRVHVRKDIGQAQAVNAETGAPLPLVYVKVFARKTDGSVVFFKDGYTDVRGTLAYASTHGGREKLDEVQEFSLLALSDSFGAVLRRTGPPSKSAEVNIGAARVRSTPVQQEQARIVSATGGRYCVVSPAEQ